VIRYQAYIRKLAQALRTELFLGEYALDIVFFKGAIPDYENAAATCDVDNTYLDITVKVAGIVQKHWRNKHYWTICNILCHELCHALTDPLYHCSIQRIPDKKIGAWGLVNNEWERVRERQTQRITNVVMALLPKSFYWPATVGNVKTGPKPVHRGGKT